MMTHAMTAKFKSFLLIENLVRQLRELTDTPLSRLQTENKKLSYRRETARQLPT